MALDRLQEMLSSNPQQQQDYLDFLRRYQDDPGSVSEAEAARRYRELMRNSPPEVAADAHATALDQLSAAERARLAAQYKSAHDDPNSPFDGYQPGDTDDDADPAAIGRMAYQAEQQDPDLFDKVFGQGSPLGSTLGKLAMAGVAAYMASRVLGGQNQRGASPAGGGLGGILDALGGGRGNSPAQTPAPTAEPGLHVKGSKQR